MIKLKKFLTNPTEAYRDHVEEFNNNKLKREVDVLKGQCIKSNQTIKELKNENKKSRLYIRTLVWYYAGKKMRKGIEFDFVESIREETKEEQQ